MGRQSFMVSDFYCVKCGSKGMPLPRKKANQKESGHMKKLYCLKCKCEVNHIEIKPFGDYDYEMFKKDFEEGRFLEIELPEPTILSSNYTKL